MHISCASSQTTWAAPGDAALTGGGAGGAGGGAGIMLPAVAGHQQAGCQLA
jgi:hypothetical protein